MNVDNKKVAELYLGMAKYQAGFTAHLKQGPEWSRGTLTVVMQEMDTISASFKGENLANLMKVRALVEVGCEYLHQTRDTNELQQFDRCLAGALKQADAHFGRTKNKYAGAMYEKWLTAIAERMKHVTNAIRTKGA